MLQQYFSKMYCVRQRWGRDVVTAGATKRECGIHVVCYLSSHFLIRFTQVMFRRFWSYGHNGEPAKRLDAEPVYTDPAGEGWYYMQSVSA